MARVLVCHPDTPCRAVESLSVQVESYRGVGIGSGLNLTFKLQGEMNGIMIPNRRRTRHADDLWQHTCFEAFLWPSPDQQYAEFNFSPSTEWAAYQFDAYRKNMAPLPIDAPIFWSAQRPDEFELHVSLNGPSMDLVLKDRTPWQLGLSAVIEETDGTKSYWALRHPPGKPDFHHPDCFALELAAPDLT